MRAAQKEEWQEGRSEKQKWSFLFCSSHWKNSILIESLFNERSVVAFFVEKHLDRLVLLGTLNIF